MPRVLFVAYYFPPVGGIGSIRAARFAGHLPEFGWEPLVLAPRDTPHASDPHLLFPEEKVVRSTSIELSRLCRPLRPGDGVRPADAARPSDRPVVAARLGRALREVVRRTVLFPDGQVGWFPGAVIQGSRALQSARFDLVYSSSFPITAHLVAATLSRRAGLPWVAEFRDPWSDSLPRGPLRRAAGAVEAGIAGRADRLVMPTPTWAAHFGDRWQTDVAVIPNGHDGALADVPPDDEKVISHLGSFYPRRQDLTAFWVALGRLDAVGQAPRVRFVGNPHPDVRAAASAAGVDHLLEVTGLLPQAEAIRLAQRSSALFLAGVGGTDPIARGCIPAKLFEYLATGRPILYIGDPEGDAGRLLNDQPGCYVVEATDPRAAEAGLRAALAGPTHERSVEDLGRRARAQALAGVFDAATR